MPRLSKALTGAEAIDQFVNRLKNVEAAPNINRYEPMPQQKLFSMSQAKHRILFGGNRGGKTYSGIADDVQILLRRHPHRQHLYADRPIRMRFIGVDFLEGVDQIALPLFSQFIPPSALVNGSWEDSYSAGSHMLTLADGGKCSFMSYEQHPNKFQGVSLDHIHFDEEPPKPIWAESMLRILDTNGTWTLSETPVQQLEWVDDELVGPAESGLRPEIAIFYLETLQNSHLSAQALAELTAGMSEEEKIIRLAGRYNRAGSLVFPEFTLKPPNIIERAPFMERMAADLRSDSESWQIAASMDHGYANPTAWLWHAVNRDGSIVTFDMMYAPQIIVSEWCKLVQIMNRKIAGELNLPYDWRPHFYVGDPAIKQNNQGVSGITVQQAYAMGGIPIGVDGIVKTRTGNQNVGLDKMHMYLRPRPVSAGPSASTGGLEEPWWQLVDGDTDPMLGGGTSALQSELRKARKPKQTLIQKEVKNPSEEIRDKDNHAIDGSKYFFMITHDLRPAQFRLEEDDQFRSLTKDQFGPVDTSATTSEDVMHATMSSGTSWNVTGSDYSNLE